MTVHAIISDSAFIRAHAGDTIDFVGIGDPSFAQLWAGGGTETLIGSGSAVYFHGGTGHTRMIGDAETNIFFDSHGHNDFVISDNFSFIFGFHHGDHLIVPEGTVVDHIDNLHYLLSVDGSPICTVFTHHHIHNHDIIYI